MIPVSFFYIFIIGFFGWFERFEKYCMISLAPFSFPPPSSPGIWRDEGLLCRNYGRRLLGFLLLDIRFSFDSFFWMDIMDLCASCAV